MRNFKKIMRFFRILLFAFMLSVCMVLGIAPVLLKRKEEIAVEIKMEENKSKENTIANVKLQKY